MTAPPRDPRGDRRRRLREVGGNGLDAVDIDHDGTRLVLTFLGPVPDRVTARHVRIDGPAGRPPVAATSVARPGEDDPEWVDHLVVHLDGALRHGRYRVRVVELDDHGRPGDRALEGLDRMFTDVVVAADVEAPPPQVDDEDAPPPVDAFPAGDYLARDYDDLRRLLLDQVTAMLPGWVERHEPDLMVALLELMAHVGDELSYHQDAVATEAYLQTARLRISVARHGRLVGYRLHHGCHARAWLALESDREVTLDPRDVVFLGPPTAAGSAMFSPLPVAASGPEVAPIDGRTVYDVAPREIVVRPEHNRVRFWAWGENVASLPRHATEAVLVDTDGRDHQRVLRLGPGSVLVLEEVDDGTQFPPDPGHRHVVRLTDVQRDCDPLYDDLPLLRVTWSPDDALPFELPIRSGADLRDRAAVAANVLLVGHGRLVGAAPDGSGEIVDGTALSTPHLTWSVPYPDLDRVSDHQAVRLRDLATRWFAQLERRIERAADEMPLSDDARRLLRRQLSAEVVTRLGLDGEGDGGPDTAARDLAGLLRLRAEAGSLLGARWRRLEDLARFAVASGPLREPMIAELRDDWGPDLADRLGMFHPAGWGSATEALAQDPRAARPLVRVRPVDEPPVDATDRTVSALEEPTPTWPVLADTAEGTVDRPGVVVEVDDADVAHLRAVPAGTPRGAVHVDYWVGNGTVGNVPAEAIARVAVRAGVEVPDVRVRNPLPAAGGVDPEDLDAARRAIPGSASATPRRALSPDQYAEIVTRVPGVRRAAARARWTGRRIAIEVAVQPRRGDEADADLRHRVDQAIARARRIGHDARVVAPRYRGVVVAVDVDLEPHAVRDEVRAAVAATLGRGRLPDGTPGMFHPERQGFGGVVRCSRVVAAVAPLAGVRAVTVRELAFADAPPPGRGHASDDRVPEHLELGPLQIARLDDDPARPERGHCRVTLRGGR